MKELDFDELDRAVNTLMSDVPSTPAPRVEDDHTTTLNIPSTLGGDEPMPAFTPPTAPVTPPVAAPVVGTPPPAARRGGRFMDVVHPSSDMKTSLNSSSKPVSRQGVTIAPMTPSFQPEPIAPTPQQVDEMPVVDESQSWPDPLDMAGYNREPDTATTAAESDTPAFIPVAPELRAEEPTVAEEPVALLTEVSEPDEEQPLSTPFLSDAKVEKRPLGTNSTEELDRALSASVVTTESDTPNVEDQLSAMPEPTAATLPAELQTDVLSIESDVPMEAADDADSVPRESNNTISTAEAAPSVGPTSIQQQYKEQPSTGDQTTGGIYDTDSYRQPLAHPAKKKSGWMWVIWVVVLLILGGAGGAVAYLYLLK